MAEARGADCVVGRGDPVCIAWGTDLTPGLVAGDFGLNLQPVNERGVGFLECLFHETCHEDVALHVDVLADVETDRGEVEAEFGWLGDFAWEAAAYGPFIADGWGA